MLPEAIGGDGHGRSDLQDGIYAFRAAVRYAVHKFVCCSSGLIVIGREQAILNKVVFVPRIYPFRAPVKVEFETVVGRYNMRGADGGSAQYAGFPVAPNHQ